MCEKFDRMFNTCSVFLQSHLKILSTPYKRGYIAGIYINFSTKCLSTVYSVNLRRHIGWHDRELSRIDISWTFETGQNSTASMYNHCANTVKAHAVHSPSERLTGVLVYYQAGNWNVCTQRFDRSIDLISKGLCSQYSFECLWNLVNTILSLLDP